MDIRPLRLLSLDGGGVKGLTSLLLLQQIFVAVENEVGHPVQPYECFDMIGGTSTGGLIAIMLGRLCMTIEEAIAAYRRLSPQIFKRKWWTQIEVLKYFGAETQNYWFSSKNLEEAVQGLLKDRGLDPKLKLREVDDPECRVFVCTVSASATHTELLRSYRSRTVGHLNYDCYLWEAVRATSAAPLFFKPVTLEDRKTTFVDGGVRVNNPVDQVINEAKRIWPNRDIGCLVSLGTGISTTKGFDPKKSRLHEVLQSLANIATDANNNAREFRERNKSLFQSQKYFRFSVPQGMDGVDLADFKKIPYMESLAVPYVVDNDDKIEQCAKSLAHPNRNSAHSRSKDDRIDYSATEMPSMPPPTAKRKDGNETVTDGEPLISTLAQGTIGITDSGQPQAGYESPAVNLAAASTSPLPVTSHRALSETGPTNKATEPSRKIKVAPQLSSSLVSSTTAEAEVIDPFSTTGPLGFRIVSDPLDALFDVWFVHGLTGDREATWTHKNGTFWPSLLAKDLPKARIITYGYDANIANFAKTWQNASLEGLRSYGEGLVYSIRNLRQGLPGPVKRPIYFIPHSLGGLVVEQALLISIGPDQSLHGIAAAASGIMFMGTPHNGSHLAEWGHVLRKLVPARIRSSNEKVLEALNTTSDVYVTLEKAFQTESKHGKFVHIKLFSFYETLLMPGLTKLIVPKKSAVLGGDFKCPIHGTHISMTKFEGMQDTGYWKVRDLLRDWTTSTE